MEEKSQNKDIYKLSRFMYILEAAFEYFVSLSVTSVYLAKVTSYLNVSDSLTGILSSFVSLGCGFQLIAIFLAGKRPVKRWVTIGHIISQLLFAFIYVVPLLDLSFTAKTVIFVIVMLCAYVIHNVIHAPKINWYMSLIDDDKRGRFTANKEIVSLIGGMAYSYGLGALVDYFESKGDMRSALITCGAVVFTLMLLHSLTLFFSKEKPAEQKTDKTSTLKAIGELFRDKDFLKIILVFSMWSTAAYTTVSFMGTYQTKELGFSLTFASVIIMIGSIIRAVISRTMGKFADKYSFAKMLTVCFIIVAVGFGINAFTVPSNGKILYTVYYILYCTAMAGISNASINLIYDYVEPRQRIQALAVNATFSGFAGFLVTLLMSRLVAHIQQNGNRFLGIPIYAQQVMSIFSFIITVVLIAYMLTVVPKIKRKG